MVLASAGFAACRMEENIEREATRVTENIVRNFTERILKKG
jgi:hypothetical protein